LARSSIAMAMVLPPATQFPDKIEPLDLAAKIQG
jgi:hypothetical protein